MKEQELETKNKSLAEQEENVKPPEKNEISNKNYEFGGEQMSLFTFIPFGIMEEEGSAI